MSHAGQTLQEANDFLALEPRLVELARQAVQGQSPAVHVLVAAQLAGMQEAAQHTPAIHIVYGGWQALESAGTAWRLQHQWDVTAAVRSAAQLASGAAARQGAGALLAQVLAAMLGQRLPGAASALDLAGRQPPPQYHAGVMYLGALLQVQSVFKKNP